MDTSIPDGPEQFMGDAPLGTVIYGFSDDAPPQIDFLIRDSSASLRNISPRSELQIRAGCITQNGIPVVTVMLGFATSNPASSILYQSFWNYQHTNNESEEENIFTHMAGDSDQLNLKFFGDQGRLEKALTITHPLSRFFQQMLAQLESAPVWTEGQFRHAVGEVLDDHPTPQELWEALGISS